MNPQSFLNGKVVLHAGDSRDVLKGLPDASIDSVVTDPPYALVSIGKRFGNPDSAPAKDVYGRGAAGFMGKQWDTGETAFSHVFWAEIYRVLKPGGHVVAFGGTRTYHRLACAIEDAGFEIRDQLAWAYGSGFPKSHDVSKGIDKAAGAERTVIAERYTTKRLKPGATVEKDGGWGKQDAPYTATDSAPATDAARQWQGWGTALKPAWEPICLARKPLSGTVVANVLAHGTGALNIDGCRIGDTGARNNGRKVDSDIYGKLGTIEPVDYDKGRWPANIIHDGSEEVLAAFPQTSSGEFLPHRKASGGSQIGTFDIRDRSGEAHPSYGDRGSAARFFYAAKADADDRLASRHPTVKPVDLIQWLVRMVTPPGGTVLDPFAGTGTTGEAAWREGSSAVLIEREAEYLDDIARRMDLVDQPLKRAAVVKGRGRLMGAEGTPLFGGDDSPDDRGGERSTATSETRTGARDQSNQTMSESNGDLQHDRT